MGDGQTSSLPSFPSLSLNLLEFITAAVNQRGGNRVGAGGGAWLSVDVDSFLNLRNCTKSKVTVARNQPGKTRNP